MKRAMIYLCVVLAFPVWHVSPGQTRDTDGIVLSSQEEAVARALSDSPELARLQAAVKKREERVSSSAWAVNNPELRLRDISTQYADEKEDNKQLQIGLRWKPPRIGELSGQQEEARLAMWREKADAQRFRLKLIARVRKQYVRVIMLRDALQLAERRVRLEKSRLSVITDMVQLGQQGLVDRVKARRRHITASADANGLRHRYEDAEKRLALLIGNTGSVSVAGEMPEPQEMAAETKLVRLAQANRLDIKVAAQRTNLAGQRLREERFRMIPWFSFIELAYHYESSKTDWGELVLGVELPFFNWNGSRYRAAALNDKQQRNGIAAVSRSVEDEVLSALANYRQRYAEWASLHEEAGTALTETSRIAEEARKNNLPENEVLSLEISDIELRRMLLQAAYDCNIAAAELCEAAGAETIAQLAR